MQLQRLNMDNSWFLGLGNTSLLIDPWLEGPEVDYASWFNTQWHKTPPLPYPEIPAFDAILITQKYPDHFHEVTLKKLDPKVIFAPHSLRKRISSLLPDAETYFFDKNRSAFDWRGLTLKHLPTRRRIDPIYDAFLIDDGEASVMIASHGLNVDDEHAKMIQASSPCKLLISPFNRYQLPSLLGGTVTPGLAGLEPLVEAVQPTHIVQTHDELKNGKGLIPALASITVFEPQEASDTTWLMNRFVHLDNYEPLSL